MKYNTRKITLDEVKRIMDEHALWVERKPGGREAFIQLKDLSNLDLKGFDFRYVKFSGSDFSNSDMEFVNLAGASLIGCTMVNVNLTAANLNSAKMDYSDLTGANLTKAEMFSCSLDKAILKDANLTGANMEYVSLFGSNLENATLIGIKSTNSLRGQRITSIELQTGYRNRVVQVTLWKDLNLVTSRNFQGTMNDFKKHVESNFLNNKDTISCYKRAISYIEAEIQEY